MRSKIGRCSRLRRDERGAEAVEFALITPILFILIFGLFYLLLMFAAYLSLGYATNVAVRYAAIPISGTNYPSQGQVLTKALNATPFFSNSGCTPELASGAVNKPVTFTLNCNFPNPAGSVANALSQGFYGGGSDIDSTVELTATARSRKE